MVSAGRVGPRGLPPAARAGRGKLAGRLAGGRGQDEGDTRADRWCNGRGAERYWVRESGSRTEDEALVALPWWKDEQQLTDFEEDEESGGTGVNEDFMEVY